LAEPELIYKITVLDLLDKSPVPLSNSQITEFFTEGNYTGYFTVQKVLHNLSDTKMIESESDHNTTIYSITESGRETFRLFREKITPAIDADIKRYLKENGTEICEENSVSANYDKASDGGYVVNMQYRKADKTVMDFSLNVPQLAQAEAICTNWKEKYMDVYAIIMDNLIL
jgi:DNA-binding PadR family transcriptional regulator